MNSNRCSKEKFLSIIDGKVHDSCAHVSSFAVYPNSKYLNDSGVQKKDLARLAEKKYTIII
ncbi:hypothetical protein DY052_04155 [Apilactobacillus timberlakei]|nr:hypothetical protein DY052_04155 [Apilactobacillus timberlakei]